jgi:polyhydroxyalkanoate synthase
MQAAFHLLRPTLNASKAIHLLDRDWDDEGLDGFFAVERWGNDNVSFPGECYRTYINDLYKKDLFIKGELRLGAGPARLESIRCPVLAITFEHDHIVPAPSASVLLERCASTDKTHRHLPGGHVGAVVSRSSIQTLWTEISEWWAARDSAPRIAKRRRAPTSSARN